MTVATPFVRSDMEIALIGEGTYPYQFGGVSVWCDQLIRGLPAHDFRVIALVATGAEPVKFELPENVLSVDPVPLWGPSPASPRRRRGRRTPSRQLLLRFVEALLSPHDEKDVFGEALRELFEFSKLDSLQNLLISQEAVEVVGNAWREHWPDRGVPTPTVQDAAMAVQVLEHSLRPLARPPVRADVAHAVTNGLGALPALACKWEFDMPMLVTEHGVALREQFLHHRESPYGWAVKAFYLGFMRRLCILCYHEAQTIAPGNVYNRRWEERLGADAAKVRTVYNGVEPDEFPAVTDEPAVPTISWAGRIDPFKDLETLIRAFATVAGELPTARLRLFGSAPPGRGPYLEECKRLVRELGLERAVTFEGRVEEIRDAYGAGSIVVLCSITEGFPYTLIEAMTCGRACIGTDVGGVSEAIGDTGFVVPPRDPEALADACLTLLRDDELRRRLGAAARVRALEYFTVDRAISAYDEIYSFLGARRVLPTASDALEARAAAAAPSGGKLETAAALAGEPASTVAFVRPQPDLGDLASEMLPALRAAVAGDDWTLAAAIATVVAEFTDTRAEAARAGDRVDELADIALEAAGFVDDARQAATEARRWAEEAVSAAAVAEQLAVKATESAAQAARAAQDGAERAADAQRRADLLGSVVAFAHAGEPAAWHDALEAARRLWPEVSEQHGALAPLEEAG